MAACATGGAIAPGAATNGKRSASSEESSCSSFAICARSVARAARSASLRGDDAIG